MTLEQIKRELIGLCEKGYTQAEIELVLQHITPEHCERDDFIKDIYDLTQTSYTNEELNELLANLEWTDDVLENQDLVREYIFENQGKHITDDLKEKGMLEVAKELRETFMTEFDEIDNLEIFRTPSKQKREVSHG